VTPIGIILLTRLVRTVHCLQKSLSWHTDKKHRLTSPSGTDLHM